MGQRRGHSPLLGRMYKVWCSASPPPSHAENSDSVYTANFLQKLYIFHLNVLLPETILYDIVSSGFWADLEFKVHFKIFATAPPLKNRLRRAWLYNLHLRTLKCWCSTAAHDIYKLRLIQIKYNVMDFEKSKFSVQSLNRATLRLLEDVEWTVWELCKNARRWVVRRICHHPGNLTRSEDASAFHVCLNVISYQFHTVLRLRVVLRLLLQRIRDVDVVRKVRSLSDNYYIFNCHGSGSYFLVPTITL